LLPNGNPIGQTSIVGRVINTLWKKQDESFKLFIQVLCTPSSSSIYPKLNRRDFLFMGQRRKEQRKGIFTNS